MKKHQFMVHPFKFAAALLTLACCLPLALYAAWLHHWISFAIFLAIAILFGVIAVNYGAVLTIDESGVQRSFLGIPLRRMSWSEIKEVGVVGLKVFSRNSKRTGTRYIYFSPRPLDKDARFRLALEWPPRQMLYASYNRMRVEAIQFLWTGPIETYNAGDVFF